MPTRHPYLDGPHPRAFAHRGWHVDDLAGMENALSAFRRAAAEGYHYLETDVHATADGVVVVHHDASLDRTTDGRGAVAGLSWKAVSRARIAGREPVCRLVDLLEELPEARLNVDVKSDAAVEPVLAALRRANAWDRVCLASFDERRLARLRRLGGPRLLTSLGPRSAGALWAGARVPGLPLRRAVRGALAQLPRRHGRLTVVDRPLVRLAHRWGLEVHVWTVDDEAEMVELLGLGVDGLVTDRPDLLRAVLRARGSWPAAV
ncbi:glycerophosphodiester phosphodiesterase family protein [Streptoalloteichus hindustanus]|uniref:Glycerophosphoryl diester phosphodiesterase n=1 Tax=Streptoalloteichus hindustanus TaxID=2017 RepID=A0A1M5DJ73_STRHI|nr:glycerophosphodiester phosphodiesterase family protein [Streptoalloteichus hindustanus]SHF67033.1 glycerophosphoryl diester phosphodiesterase [Streptoalloteichus hindustanus]